MNVHKQAAQQVENTKLPAGTTLFNLMPERQKCVQTDRQMDRKIDKWIERQTNGQIYIQIDRWNQMKMQTERENCINYSFMKFLEMNLI